MAVIELVTDESLQAAYAAFQAAQPPPKGTLGRSGAQDGEWAGTPSVGVHLEGDFAHAVIIGTGLVPKATIRLAAGYHATDAFLGQFAAWLEQQDARNLPIIITLSGKEALSLTTRTPELPKPRLKRAFQLELKAQSGEDREDVSYVSMGSAAPAPQELREYLVASLTEGLRERIASGMRRLRLRVAAWDLDLLCYARSALALTRGEEDRGGTTLALILDWGDCRILLLSGNRLLSVNSLDIGISAFLDQIAAGLQEPQPDPRWLEAASVTMKSDDPPEERKRELQLNQMVFGLYAPMLQQIQLELHSLTNERGFEMPSRLVVMGAGAKLFRIAESLEMDIGIPALSLDHWLAPESAAAMGASLWERNGLRMNFLPRGTRQNLQAVKDTALTIFERVKARGGGRQMVKSSFQGFQVKVPARAIAAIAVFVVLLALVPIVRTHFANRRLAVALKELEKLEPQQQQIDILRKLELQIEKFKKLKAILQGQRGSLTAGVKDVLFSLPPDIRLDAVAFRSGGATLRGVAKNQGAFEVFLEAYSRLSSFGDAVPINVVSGKRKLVFEVLLKPKEIPKG